MPEPFDIDKNALSGAYPCCEARSAMTQNLADCPLTTALEIIGGRWNLVVLYALAQEPRRFNELQRLAPGVSHKVLTQTVRHLEAEGLVEREIGNGPVPCVRYSLTDLGETVRPVLTVLIQWGNARLQENSSGTDPHQRAGVRQVSPSGALR